MTLSKWLISGCMYPKNTSNDDPLVDHQLSSFCIIFCSKRGLNEHFLCSFKTKPFRQDIKIRTFGGQGQNGIGLCFKSGNGNNLNSSRMHNQWRLCMPIFVTVTMHYILLTVGVRCSLLLFVASVITLHIAFSRVLYNFCAHSMICTFGIHAWHLQNTCIAQLYNIRHGQCLWSTPRNEL